MWFTRLIVDRRSEDIHVCGPFNIMSTSGIEQAPTKNETCNYMGADLLTMNVKRHCSVRRVLYLGGHQSYVLGLQFLGVHNKE